MNMTPNQGKGFSAVIIPNKRRVSLDLQALSSEKL
jgi:hypothetical protein